MSGRAYGQRLAIRLGRRYGSSGGKVCTRRHVRGHGPRHLCGCDHNASANACLASVLLEPVSPSAIQGLALCVRAAA